LEDRTLTLDLKVVVGMFLEVFLKLLKLFTLELRCLLV